LLSRRIGVEAGNREWRFASDLRFQFGFQAFNLGRGRDNRSVVLTGRLGQPGGLSQIVPDSTVEFEELSAIGILAFGESFQPLDLFFCLLERDRRRLGKTEFSHFRRCLLSSGVEEDKHEEASNQSEESRGCPAPCAADAVTAVDSRRHDRRTSRRACQRKAFESTSRRELSGTYAFLKERQLARAEFTSECLNAALSIQASGTERVFDT
jgi:hypothetical protein